jgi:Adenosine deaminase
VRYLAQYILDKRLPLEICLSSNVDTGAAKSLETHPFGIYYRYNFRVTLNTDDRLMSDTTMTKEFRLAHQTFDLALDDLEKITINSMKSRPDVTGDGATAFRESPPLADSFRVAAPGLCGFQPLVIPVPLAG